MNRLRELQHRGPALITLTAAVGFVVAVCVGMI
jgi:hypothetical protein